MAVKELNSSAAEVDRVKFLKEAFIMSQFNHTNVVKVHGVVTITDPVSVQVDHTHTVYIHCTCMSRSVCVGVGVGVMHVCPLSFSVYS